MSFKNGKSLQAAEDLGLSLGLSLGLKWNWKFSKKHAFGLGNLISIE